MNAKDAYERAHDRWMEADPEYRRKWEETEAKHEALWKPFIDAVSRAIDIAVLEAIKEVPNDKDTNRSTD